MKEFVEERGFKNDWFSMFTELAYRGILPDKQVDRMLNSIKETKVERLSHCCGAPVEYDSDICSDPKCGEHCSLICPDCAGEGYIDVLADYQGDADTPRLRNIMCENCKGDGVVEA